MLVSVGCLLSFSLSWPVFASLLNQANKAFKKGDYEEALKKYNRALTQQDKKDLVNFNIGCVQYKKKDYSGAIESFNKSLLTEDPSLEAKAYYNIGNCKYRLARIKENTNLSQAIDLYREALFYYQKAIEKNPQDKDAKYNHEFVEKVLKDLLDRLKKKAQKEKGSSEKKQKKEAKKNQETSQKAGDLKKEAQEIQEKEPLKQSLKSKTEKKEDKESSSKTAQLKKPLSMTEKEARMLLESFSQEEESMPRRNRKRSLPVEVYKDW